jgi:hypothetical protein
VNLVVRGLLRTPGLCSLIGSRLLTLYLVGRKSGRRYPVPVAYLADGDDLLLGTSAGMAAQPPRQPARRGAPQGKHRWADVTTYTTESDVVSAYARMARSNPTFAKLNSIRLSDDGEPDNSDLRLAWLGGARAIRLTPGDLIQDGPGAR